MPPGVTITATLQNVMAGTGPDPGIAIGSKLQVTLCGFGPQIPVVPGVGPLAFGGIPQEVIQDDATPISINLYNNALITPGGTFYCIALLDDEDDVIQANNYQFLEDGSFDLSNVQPIIPGTPTMYAETPKRITPYQFQLTTNVIGGEPIGIYFNGSYQRPGIDYDLNGRLIVTTFPIIPPDNIFAVYMGLGNGGLLVGSPQLTVDALTPMGATSWTLSKKPVGGLLVGLYYNGSFERPTPPSGTPTLDYQLTGSSFQTVTPNFATYPGDNVYAVYYGT